MTPKILMMAASCVAVSTALAGCGAPSDVDAATLNGYSATDFLFSGQLCDSDQFMRGVTGEGMAVCAQDQVGQTATGDATTLDGMDSNEFVAVSGDSMTGPLTVPAVSYTAPQKSWASVGPAAFTARFSSDSVLKHLGQGEVYIEPGGSFVGGLVAGIQLPHGAQVLEFKAYWADTDGAADVTTSLYAYDATDGSSVEMATIASSGSGGRGSASTTSIATDFDVHLVDNENLSYAVMAFGTNPDVRFGGAAVHYQVTHPVP